MVNGFLISAFARVRLTGREKGQQSHCRGSGVGVMLSRTRADFAFALLVKVFKTPTTVFALMAFEPVQRRCHSALAFLGSTAFGDHFVAITLAAAGECPH